MIIMDMHCASRSQQDRVDSTAPTKKALQHRLRKLYMSIIMDMHMISACP